MDSRTFIIFNAALVLLLIFFFIKGRKQPVPSKLNLKGPKRLDGAAPDLTMQREENTKQLTIYFNFNGETLEAYQVLGLPAGASVEMAKNAHKELMKSPKVESTDVYNQALDAILKVRS